MSKEDFVEAYEHHVQGNAQLKQQMDRIDDPTVFVATALALGSKAGFPFSEQDVFDVMEASAKEQNPQLSDDQLDGVVAGAATSSLQAVPTVKLTTVGKLTPDGGLVSNPGCGTTMCCW
jgi:hypothetical protein